MWLDKSFKFLICDQEFINLSFTLPSPMYRCNTFPQSHSKTTPGPGAAGPAMWIQGEVSGVNLFELINLINSNCFELQQKLYTIKNRDT